MNDILLVVQMITFMEQNLTQPLTTEGLAEKSGYSINRFRQKFFNVTGDTPSGYLRKRRLTEAAKEILSGKRSLDISLDYGYSTQENFITAFRGYFGITPSELCKMDAKFKHFFSKFKEVLNIMELANLKQPPLCSTDMGCIKGASDYFDNDLSTAMLFGLSGYGYMINIHKELCPSGPYVWNRKRFYSLLTDNGLAFQKEYDLTKDSTLKERETVESELRNFLNNGCLCVLGYLESQLISGYDEDGFIILQPWGDDCVPSTVQRLSFGTWTECLDKEGWVAFAVFAPNEKRNDILTSIKKSWEYGLELYRTPEIHQVDGYRINHGAVQNWIACVEQDMGSSHGNWWNGMVWTEARSMMAQFFNETVGLFDSEEIDDMCRKMADLYKESSTRLELIKEKDLEKNKKISLLRELEAVEKSLEKGLEQLLSLV